MTKLLRPLLILGTRPEAIKMAPLVMACRRQSALVQPTVCFTGQHTDMLRQVTDYFGIEPDVELQVLTVGQSLAKLTARLLTALDELLEQRPLDCVVAQGDTTSVMVAALAAFYRQLPFVHVEAGLRTGNILSPWPEEFNRRVAGLTTMLHCAPTELSASNLLREGIPAESVRVVGNTVIDALLWTAAREQGQATLWQDKYAWLQDRPLILITTHRRENHGDGLSKIFRAVQRLAALHPQVQFLFPVHRNPVVQTAAGTWLADQTNVHLVEPLPYPEFVWLMQRAKLILSDSGGVQEEAPSLRVPVLALRESTERPESVHCGAVELVGTDEELIVRRATQLLTDPLAYQAMQIKQSPYGDGTSAEQILSWMLAAIPRRDY